MAPEQALSALQQATPEKVRAALQQATSELSAEAASKLVGAPGLCLCLGADVAV